ncbi:N-acetyltransferase [Marinomonas sp. PE14-40]|uniref:N-acetyltransferase n=1 Tax=Marinomonas sp. PE14-40 TaxID=3060621 RepID=UPI003F6743DF
MQNKRARDAYSRYFRLNNKRSLSTMLPSELSIIESLGLIAYIDKTRKYDNQILIHRSCDLDYLTSVYSLYDPESLPEISIEAGLESDELKLWLNEHGYQPSNQHDFLSLNRSQAKLNRMQLNNVTVERWQVDRADDFLALLKTSGLTCSDQIWKEKKSYYCTESFRVFIAYFYGNPCAWATSYVKNDVAILANAFTQEDVRGQGCQLALLNTRIEDAIALETELILTDVIPDSISQKNCRSVGFISDGIRQVWVRG